MTQLRRNIKQSVGRLKKKPAPAIAAIRRGLAQAERGEGIPLDDAVKLLKQKHGL